MKNLVLCISLFVLFGSAAQAIRIVNNSDKKVRAQLVVGEEKKLGFDGDIDPKGTVTTTPVSQNDLSAMQEFGKKTHALSIRAYIHTPSVKYCGDDKPITATTTIDQINNLVITWDGQNCEMR